MTRTFRLSDVDLPVMPPIRPMLARTTTLEKALALLPDVQLEPKWDAFLAAATVAARFSGAVIASLSIPALASRSATSLRLTPEWPFTHRNVTSVDTASTRGSQRSRFRHRLLGRRLPVVGEPLAPPRLVEAVHDVLRVRPDDQRPGKGADRLKRGADLHALVRG
jgi:hypothetical protein